MLKMNKKNSFKKTIFFSLFFHVFIIIVCIFKSTTKKINSNNVLDATILNVSKKEKNNFFNEHTLLNKNLKEKKNNITNAKKNIFVKEKLKNFNKETKITMNKKIKHDMLHKEISDKMKKEKNLKKKLSEKKNAEGKKIFDSILAQYIKKVKNSIQNKFYNPEFYQGKNCVLKLNLSQEGILLNIKSMKGDPNLCRAALIATKRAYFPKPPNKAIYTVFKNVPIIFDPK